MPSPLSGFGPLTGPGSTRRLGTEAGALRREARKVRRAGGDDRRLLEASGLSGMRDGSISSADSNIEEASFNRRAAAGLGAARQGVLREMAGQGSAVVPPPTTPGGGTGMGGGSAVVPPPSTGETPLQGKSPKPTGEEVASDERRRAMRQSVLREVLARSGKDTGMTRRGALEQINKERVAAGKTMVDFEDEEYVAESEAQKAPAREAERARRRSIREDLISMDEAGRDIADEGAAAQRRTPTTPPATRIPGPTSRASGAAMRGPKPATPRPEPRGLLESLRRDADAVGSSVAGVARGVGSQLGATVATGARRAGAVVGAGAGVLRNAAEVAALQAADALKTTGRRVGTVTPGATGRYLRSLK